MPLTVDDTASVHEQTGRVIEHRAQSVAGPEAAPSPAEMADLVAAKRRFEHYVRVAATAWLEQHATECPEFSWTGVVVDIVDFDAEAVTVTYYAHPGDQQESTGALPVSIATSDLVPGFTGAEG